jgi:enterochelin esterase-like enzyme
VTDEIVLRLEDRSRRLRAVRLLADLTKRGARPEFVRVRGARAWELRLPRPPVDRIEYQLELVHRDGRSEIVCDPTNAVVAPGVFGAKSVLELDGYVPPAWLDDDEAPAGETAPISVHVRGLRAHVEGLLWSSATSEPYRPLPLLVVHDGPEYARFSALTRYLDSATAELELPPMRAALLAPVRGARNQHYSASARYAAAFRREILPVLVDLAPGPDDPRQRIGMGASLGALAMLHLHRVAPWTFGGLFLQSGSYFRRRSDAHETGFERFARVSRFVGRVLNAREWEDPIPVTLTCGAGEENLQNNRAVAAALAAQAYPVELIENRDAHTWVGWRDTFDPHLTALIQRAWG